MLFPVAPSGCISLEDAFDFIPHLTEDSQNFFVTADRASRVNERPMMAIHLSGKNRTGLIRIAANRNQRLNVLFQKFVQMLGMMPEISMPASCMILIASG